jgi:hypothetical protein
MAMPLLWMRQPDTMGVLGLAINTCAERNGNADAADRIRELLVTARDLWTSSAGIADEHERMQTVRLSFRLIHIADIEAVTAPV